MYRYPKKAHICLFQIKTILETSYVNTYCVAFRRKIRFFKKERKQIRHQFIFGVVCFDYMTFFRMEIAQTEVPNANRTFAFRKASPTNTSFPNLNKHKMKLNSPPGCTSENESRGL